MTELLGWISEYYEQGMEGDYWHTFQDGRYTESHERGWDRAGMYILRAGDHLTIIDVNGETLWQGVLQPRRHGFLRLCVLKVDARWHPEHIPYDQWRGWFRHRPALEAKLIKQG